MICSEYLHKALLWSSVTCECHWHTAWFVLHGKGYKKESESLHFRVAVMVWVLVVLGRGIPCLRCLQEWEGVCYLLKDELNDIVLMDEALDGYL